MTTLRRPPEATPSFRPATAGRKSAPGRLVSQPVRGSKKLLTQKVWRCNAERVVFIEGQVTYKDGSGGTISLPTMGRETLEVHIKGEGFTGVNPKVSRKLLLDQDGKFVIALNRDQLSSAGGVIFLRTGSSLWKTFTVSAQTTHQVVAVNLRYGDIDQNNIIQVQASAPYTGDSAVWNNALSGLVAMDDPFIYKFDHRADVDRDMAVVPLDNLWLLSCLGSTNTGDALQ